jgi:hypothetical protein
VEIERHRDRVAFHWGNDWELMLAYDLGSWQVGVHWRYHTGWRCLSLFFLCFDIHLSKWLTGFHEYVDCPAGSGCDQCMK